jgi:hypothetical protein
MRLLAVIMIKFLYFNKKLLTFQISEIYNYRP